MEDGKRTKAEYRSSIRSKVMIREALLALMLEKPFEKISITDIVRKADINRGTFYAHFKNTNEVLNSISSSIVEEIARNLSKLDADGMVMNPMPFLVSITEFIKNDREFFEKLLQTDKFSDVLESARYASIEYIRQFVDLNEDGEKCFFAILDYTLAGVTTLYIDIVLKKVPVDLDDSANYINRILGPQVQAIHTFINNNKKIPESTY